MKAVLWLCLPALLILVAGCGGDASSPKEKTYEIKGKIVAVDREKKTVTLDHEAIPGIMKAMQMPFAVDNVKVLENILPDDQVQGRLRVKAGEMAITEMHKR